MDIKESGNLRIDFLGSTLDISPIDLIIPNSVTLNAAISLKVRVTVRERDLGGVEIVSKDYDTKTFFPVEDFVAEKLYGGHFKEFAFVAQILHHFGEVENISLELESDSPTGGGLGGSSVLGITLYRALAHRRGVAFEPMQAIRVIRDIESRILDSGPAGYQDYYPVLYGGVLGLQAEPGEVRIHQLYTPRTKQFLEEHLTLVNSRISHHSGVNNWQLYKSFFDKEPDFRKKIDHIAELAWQAFEGLKSENLGDFMKLISSEGRARAEFFPDMEVSEVRELYASLLKQDKNIGLKVCGAGGGGCFLLIHPPESRPLIEREVGKTKMEILPLQIEGPLKE